MASKGKQPLPDRNFSGGVVETAYPHRLLRSQCARAVNFNMTAEGEMETRGGSIRVTDTVVASTGQMCEVQEFVKRETSGALTIIKLWKSGTSLYAYNTSTGVFDAVATGLATAKPSFAKFYAAAGGEIILYADGTNFCKYDGTTWTSILTAFQAGAGSGCPKYIFAKHNVVFAAGDNNFQDVVFYCDAGAVDTAWPAGGSIEVADEGIEVVTGLGELYNYVFVLGMGSAGIITGVDSTEFAYIKVASTGGLSHWSIVSQGQFVYWANANGINVGKLRAAEDDGMTVDLCSNHVAVSYGDIVDGSWDEIEGCYNDNTKHIYWAVRTGVSATPDKLLAYNVTRSHPEQVADARFPDTRYVWAGYHESAAFSFSALAMMQDGNGTYDMYVGGSDGYVRKYMDGYKDDRAVGTSTGTNVAYELRTREEIGASLSAEMRIRTLMPTLYQKYNGGFSVQAVINRTRLHPATPRPIVFRGNIPYWNGGANANVTTQWGSTIWSRKPILGAVVNMGQKANSVFFIFTCDGSNAREEGTLIGYDLLIQALRKPSRKAA